MKKIAVVLDFDPKWKDIPVSNHYDIFILDRFHDKITEVIVHEGNEFKDALEEEMTIKEFYSIIAQDYKQIFCLFLSYNYTDIEDHVITRNINENRLNNQAKMFTYLLNFQNPSKQEMINQSLELIEKNYEIKEIIVRIHQIRKKESFFNNVILRYLSSVI